MSSSDTKKRSADAVEVVESDEKRRKSEATEEGGVKLHPCSHEVCLPATVDAPPASDAIYDPPLPETLVREYPFVLDNFQRKSIGCLHRKESVLVAAHTSAGKTVVAE